MESFFYTEEREGKHILMMKDIDEETGAFCILLKTEMESYIRPTLRFGYDSEEKMESVWKNNKNDLIETFLDTVNNLIWNEDAADENGNNGEGLDSKDSGSGISEQGE